MAALDTYTAIGNKEDVTGLVTMISPEETPIFSMVAQGKCINTTHSWLNKSLRASKVNTSVEGAALTYEAAKARTKSSNYTQIFQQGYSVTGSQEAVEHWGGVGSEIDDAMADAMKELALDVELAWVSADTAEDGDSSTARIAGGLPYFITTNVYDNGGTTRVYTETLLKTALQGSWTQGGVPKYVFQSGNQQNVANAFKGGNMTTVDAKAKQIVACVDKYVSSFGTITFVPHRQITDLDVFVIDAQYLSTDFLRRFKDTELPKTADAMTHNILGELTFVCKAEAAQAWITDLKAS